MVTGIAVDVGHLCRRIADSTSRNGTTAAAQFQQLAAQDEQLVLQALLGVVCR